MGMDGFGILRFGIIRRGSLGWVSGWFEMP
jgi:hypothetical protein